MKQTDVAVDAKFEGARSGRRRQERGPIQSESEWFSESDVDDVPRRFWRLDGPGADRSEVESKAASDVGTADLCGTEQR